MSIRSFIILALLGSLVFTACKKKAATESANDLSDFQDFHNRFLRDSLYQIAHIQFPLEGIPDNADSSDVADGNFRWQLEDWKMHRKFDAKSNGFSVKFQPFGDNIVNEYITHESNQYAMMRRFAKTDGEWRLIYYAGLNPLAE